MLGADVGGIEGPSDPCRVSGAEAGGSEVLCDAREVLVKCSKE